MKVENLNLFDELSNIKEKNSSNSSKKFINNNNYNDINNS